MVTVERIWELLNTIKDPEIPVVDVVGLGIVRNVELKDDTAHITITPTYSGCPAMDVIEEDIRQCLLDEGINAVSIYLVHHPAWTTDWMSEETKRKLKEYGIAPPRQSAAEALVQIGSPMPVPCPYCDSSETELKSGFGSTSCKALHYCNACQQPFEEFKVL